MKAPDDVNTLIDDFCAVSWGSHGCHRPLGHVPTTEHWCDCCECGVNHPTVDADGSLCVAGPPYYGPDTRFY